MIHAVIIDDEHGARTLLSGLLREFCKDVEVVAECADLPNGVKSIRRFKPDLVFLDIEMPGHSGLELLEFFNEEEIVFSIIFVTAYNEYATRAFRLSALDYLLKPVEPAELEESVERFRKSKLNPRVLMEAVKGFGSNKIAIPMLNATRFLSPDEVVYIKADNSYSEVYTADGAKLIVSRTLKNFDEALSGFRQFFRCHKSYLVNLDFITGFTRSDGGFIILNKTIEIPISSEKVAEFLALNIHIRR